MGKLLDVLLKTLTVSLLTFTLACGGGNSSSNLPEPIADVPSALEAGLDEGLDAVLISVNFGSGNAINFASGIADRSTGEAASSSQYFKIASISKLFIAVAATKLIVEGQIAADDNLAQWLPEYSARIANADSITLAQMIQHRSGIPDFDSQSGWSWQISHTDIDAVLEYALDLPADFAPDSQFEYSNTNYLLIAKILDRALGYDHQEYISDNILIPLDMQDTFARLEDIDPELLIHGYWEDRDRRLQDYVVPGGSMISTVEDIAKFVRALNNGTLLTQEEQTLYRTLYWLGHSGWLPGYQSIAEYHQEIDAVVIAFVSTTGGNSENATAQLYQRILDFYRSQG